MARGQAKASDQQRSITNTAAAGYGSTAAGELGPLSAGAKDLTSSEGFDPATLSAITNAGMGGVNAAFGSAKGDIQRNAGIRGNSANVGGDLDTLAMDKGIAGGKEAGDIQIQNAQFKAAQRAKGLDILNSLYGTNVGASTSLYGQAPDLLKARAANPSLAQDFGAVLGGIGGLFK